MLYALKVHLTLNAFGRKEVIASVARHQLERV